MAIVFIHDAMRQQSLVVTSALPSAALALFDGSALVETRIDTGSVFQLTSRRFQESNTIIQAGNVQIGDGPVQIIAGPCAVESREQVVAVADLLREQGIRLFRGGLFKPRTSPYTFQGLGFAGMEILRELKTRYNLRIVTEALSEKCLEQLVGIADIIQIGSRNMQNFSLLKEAGGAGCPVLLKRGLAATMEEFLLAAEYLMAHGNPQVILCERAPGTSCCHPQILDLKRHPYLKEQCHLPVIVDCPAEPVNELVLLMARRPWWGVGIMIEVPSPADLPHDYLLSLSPLICSAACAERAVAVSAHACAGGRFNFGPPRYPWRPETL